MAMSTSEECTHPGRGNEGIQVGSSDSRHSPLPAQVPLRRGQPWPSGEWTGQACRLPRGTRFPLEAGCRGLRRGPTSPAKKSPLGDPWAPGGNRLCEWSWENTQDSGKDGTHPQPLVQEPSWPRRKVGAQVSWYPAGALTTHALQSRG